MGYIVAIMLSSSAPSAPHSMHTDVVSTVDGPIATTVVQAPQSRKARNHWDRLGFSRDEGNDGTMPLVDVRKGGLSTTSVSKGGL